MLARLLVRFYILVHGKLHWPGAGWLIRRMAPLLPALRDFPLSVPGVGTARVDFRDIAAFGLVNVSLGEIGDLASLGQWLGKALRPGDVLWDVGANIGCLDLWLVRHHPQLGGIHAFEPSPQALRSLQSLFQNHPKVRVHPVGLGGEDAVLELSAPRDGTQIGSLVRQFAGGERISVPIRRGDAYCEEQQVPPPQVIKIDVEGFEPQVFAGLPETILRHRPIIFFEYVFLKDEQIRLLIPSGYSLFLIRDNGELTPDLSRRDEGHDAMLVPDEHKVWLTSAG